MLVNFLKPPLVLAQFVPEDPLPIPEDDSGFIDGFFESNSLPNDGSALLNVIDRAAEVTSGFFDQFWIDIGNANEPIWRVILNISVIFAIIFLFFSGVGWFRRMSNAGGFSRDLAEEMVWPLIIILMLVPGDGILTARTGLFIRETFVATNSLILNSSSDGLSAIQKIRILNNERVFLESLQPQINNCIRLPESLPDTGGGVASGDSNTVFETRDQCLDRVIENAEEIAREIESNRPFTFRLGQLLSVINPIRIVRDGLGTIQNLIAGLTISVWLTGLQIAYVLMIQAAFALSILGAPIALALSMLPKGEKPIFIWLSSTFGVGITLISFTIIVAFIAGGLSRTNFSNPIILPLVQAILAPLLATALGQKGAEAAYRGLSQLPARAIRLAGR